jgi:polysaccharide deacetylase family protein (PEP-CTERM system associated)
VKTVPSHHFTVDVEEYFQVSAFEGAVPRSSWDVLEPRLGESLTTLLDLLARYDVRGTFFVLGWVADRSPQLVRAIARAGHEIASHGWDHRRVTTQSADEFRESVRRTKHRLEDITGTSVIGFRAPSFSIVRGREWALDVLVEEGYLYDSSLFPIRRPGGYGYAGGRADPHWLELASGVLAEVPPTTLRRLGASIPAAGGAYFRILPYWVVRTALRDCEERGVPGTFYVHPWELDPAQPRISAPWHARLRHYTGMKQTLPRLHHLLADFRFTTIAQTVATL